jgi:hypothetical protein
MNALSFCTNITVTDGEPRFRELSSSGIVDRSLRLVVISSQVIHVLEEHVSLSSVMIARAIAEIVQQFGWSRITVVADTTDKYFLHTAEEFFKLSSLSPDSRFLQLSDSDSDIKNLIDRVDTMRLSIIVLSLRPHLVSKLLCRAHERHLVWPEYAWIVHSVEVSEESCGDNSMLNGVISLKMRDTHQPMEYENMHATDYYYLNSCLILQPAVVVQQIGKNMTGMFGSIPYPSDLPPQYVPTIYISLFYTATTICFILCTIMLVLYICFRKEPAIKATSVSLSILIFIGCYLTILYSYVLNSFLLPSFHKQSQLFLNSMCVLRIFLSGVGYPLTLVLSTLLFKLFRVYRLFRLKTRISKFTTSNLALAVYVLLMTSPNALVNLLWYIVDPYTGTVLFSVSNGYLHATVLCESEHSIKWLVVLFVYLTTISLILIIFAILTRKIKYSDFKDTKKVSILSFLLVFTGASTLGSWYLLRIIGADVILVHVVLEIGHYCVILECQGFIFAPKLFTVVKRILVRKYQKVLNIPLPKTTITTVSTQ